MKIRLLLFVFLSASAHAQVYNYFPPPGISYDSTNHTITSNQPVGVLKPGFSVNGDSTSAPIYELIDNSSAANNKRWWWLASGVVGIYAVDDTGTPGQSGIQINRSGTNITQSLLLAGSKNVGVKSTGELQLNGGVGLLGQPILSGGPGANGAYGALDLSNLNATTNTLPNSRFGPVNLATNVTGILSLANITSCATNQVLFASSATTAACNASFTWNQSAQTLTFGNGTSVSPTITMVPNSTSPAIIQCPSCGSANPFTLGKAPQVQLVQQQWTGTLLLANGDLNWTVDNTSTTDTSFFMTNNGTGTQIRTRINIGDSISASGSWVCLGGNWSGTNPDITGLPTALGSTARYCYLGTDSFGPTNYPQVFYTAGVYAGYIATDQGWIIGNPTGASKGTGSVNVTHVYSNGTELKPNFSGTTGSIGGALLAAGGCSSGTLTLTGATTTMPATASPAAGVNPDPGTLGVFWRARVSAANTVTVDVCTVIAGTPTAATYAVRVLQ